VNNENLEQTLARIPKLGPVMYIVKVPGTLAVALERYAMDEGVHAETIICEAIRAYMGDA
jgi:hypothetical protein